MSYKNFILYGITLLIITLSGSIITYSSSNTIDIYEHQEYIETLSTFQTENSVLDQALLRLMNGRLTEVDSVNHQISKLKKMSNSLKETPSFLNEISEQEVKKHLKELEGILQQKEELTEIFNADNADLRGSIDSLSVIGDDLIDLLKENEIKNGFDKIGIIETFQKDLYRFVYEFENTKLKTAIIRNLKKKYSKLEDASKLPNTPKWYSENIEDLKVHIDNILLKKPKLENRISKIMRLQIVDKLSEVLASYNKWHKHSTKIAIFYRMAFYFTLLIIVLIVAMLIIKNLDMRIQQATTEIKAKKEQLERQLAEREAMSAVTTAVNSIMDVEKVLGTIMDKSKEMLQAQVICLLLVDEESGELYYHSVRGTSETLLSTKIPKGAGVLNRTFESGKAIAVMNPDKDQLYNAKYDDLPCANIKALIAIPLATKNKTIGVMQLINPEFQNNQKAVDIPLLEDFASQASVAIENSRLYEGISKYAGELKVALERERWLALEKQKLGAYIPKQVMEQVSSSREAKVVLGGRLTRVTILFADVVGFTSLSEKLKPQETVNFLNAYMTEMADAIEKEGGFIDKFIGDGIMAIFVDTEDEDHAFKAVRAGIAMQRAVKDNNHKWGKAIHSELNNASIRVGINTGRVVTGNIGSERRMDYTVIGDNVNLASRIEGACTPGGVLINQSTYEDIKDRIKTVPNEPISVKNRQQTVNTYDVVMSQTLKI